MCQNCNRVQKVSGKKIHEVRYLIVLLLNLKHIRTFMLDIQYINSGALETDIKIIVLF